MRFQLTLALLMSVQDLSESCTYFEVPYGPSSSHDYVIGRTMELGGTFLEQRWTMEAVPQGWRYPYIAPNNRSSEMVSEIGFLCAFVDVFPLNDIVDVADHFADFPKRLCLDGMNTEGLSMSAHTHQRAQYEPTSQEDQHEEKGSLNVHFTALLPWVLGRFRNVPDVLSALEKRGSEKVWVVNEPKAPSELNIHFSLADVNGESVVLEYTGGSLRVHQNSAGVMTNDPEYEWHLLNLNQFAQVSPENPDRARDIQIQTQLGPLPLASSHGLNLLGLPGDLSPSARFVRTFYMKQLALYKNPEMDKAEAMDFATNLINAVAIPKHVLAKTRKLDVGDYTQWALLKFPSERQVLVRSYDNMQWRRIDMKLMAKWMSEQKNTVLQVRTKGIHIFSGESGIKDVTQDMHHL